MKKTFVPLYKSIYNDLKRQITDGFFLPDNQLPYEHELCKMYGVKRVTVRRALDLLVKEGIIKKRAGVGSFVLKDIQTSKGQANIILFIMQNNQNDARQNASAFNAHLLFSMERICKDAGYSLLYVSVQSDDDIFELTKQHDIAGAFFVSAVSETIINCVLSFHIPAVCLNTYDARLLSILPDNDSGVDAAITLLIQSGCRNIAFIGGMPGAKNAEERLTSYLKAIAAHGIDPNPLLITAGHWTFDGGRSAILSVLDRTSASARPDAVFAASDMMAIGAMDGIRQRGLLVPEDISVVGFDDIESCKYCSPALTSITVSVAQMASVSVEHMMALIHRRPDEKDRYIIRIPSTLVLRDSVSRV